MIEVFLTFLRLGCLSFGGPVAHIGYFRREFVERRNWCSEQAFAELVALAQTIPGPASSQIGFAIGILRRGLPGGIAAWLGFTLPSAILMIAFALLGDSLATTRAWPTVIHALQLVAVAVVAQALIAMQRSLAPDLRRIAIAVLGAAIVLLVPGTSATILAILAGVLAGLAFLRNLPHSAPAAAASLMSAISRRTAVLAAASFAILLTTSAIASIGTTPTISHIGAAFFRSGALVFGGGHVVLPLLENAVVHPGWVAQPTFLSGYAAAQALPGPLFTFAAFLGAAVHPASHPPLMGVLALIAIFLPGLLLMIAILPLWSTLTRAPNLAPAIRGIHATVVGVLLAALVRPVASSSIHNLTDLALAVGAFALLVFARLPSWLIVAIFAVGALLVTWVH